MSVALRDPIPENWDISDIGLKMGVGTRNVEMAPSTLNAGPPEKKKPEAPKS